VHVRKEIPDSIEQVDLEAPDPSGLWIVKALTRAGMCPSASEARRLVEQGAVSVDGKKVEDVETRLLPREERYVVKAGKRRFKAILVTGSR